MQINIGDGKVSEPGLDLALMSACNHSIFAYGTFALTGALLVNGGHTVVYDIGNGTATKEMQFAGALPNWYIMDKDGGFHYENKTIPLTLYI